LPFTFLRKFLYKKYPLEEQNICNVRNSLTGYGPKEIEVLETLLQEDFDFEKYLILFIESHDNLVAQEIERQKKLQYSPEIQQEIQQQITSIKELIPAKPIKISKFLDELEKVILTHLVDNYPELINAEPEDIKELQHILVNFIPDFGIKLIDHIEDIRGRE
jgi:hypothetical protein